MTRGGQFETLHSRPHLSLECIASNISLRNNFYNGEKTEPLKWSMNAKRGVKIENYKVYTLANIERDYKVTQNVMKSSLSISASSSSLGYLRVQLACPDYINSVAHQRCLGVTFLYCTYVKRTLFTSYYLRRGL